MLKNDKNIQCLVKRVPVESSTQALGIYFNPSGCMKAHFLYLKEKCQIWANKIMKSKLPRADVVTAMQCTIMKTVEYGLVATSLNREQCDVFSNIILLATLPKSEIYRNLSRKPIFSSSRFQGFGLKHPYYLH
jgi:hypothetical protein